MSLALMLNVCSTMALQYGALVGTIEPTPRDKVITDPLAKSSVDICEQYCLKSPIMCFVYSWGPGECTLRFGRAISAPTPGLTYYVFQGNFGPCRTTTLDSMTERCFETGNTIKQLYTADESDCLGECNRDPLCSGTKYKTAGAGTPQDDRCTFFTETYTIKEGTCDTDYSYAIKNVIPSCWVGA